MATNTQRITTLEAKVKTLEAKAHTHTVTPPPPPPPAGVPVIPANLGTKFRWVPAENGNTLAPFKVRTWPDAHPGDFMGIYNRYTHARKPVVAGGFVHLLATKIAGRTDYFDADLIATSQDGDGPTFVYGTYRAWLRFNVVKNGWQAFWLLATGPWKVTENDIAEMLEGLSFTFHVIGQGAGQKYGVPLPADIATKFHEFRLDRSATGCKFYIDGVLQFTITAAQPADLLSIHLDSKVGFPWAEGPTAATVEPYLDCAAVTVD